MCLIFFLYQQLHTLEKDLVSACDLLGVGAEYARVVGSEYTRYCNLAALNYLLFLSPLIICKRRYSRCYVKDALQ